MTLFEMMKRFPTEEHCIEYIKKIRWPDGKVRCPYCGHIVTDRKRVDGRYMCNSCNRAFSVTVGTLFHKSHHPLQKWFLLITLMLNAKKGTSSAQLARDIGIPQPTTWLMCMKIRKAMASDQGALLEGILEIDETYVGGKPRKKNDGGTGRGNPGTGGRKETVMGVIERDGDVRAQRIDSVNKRTIQKFLRSHAHRDARIYSDSYYVYRNIVDAQINHQERFVDGDISTNQIESFWSVVKRGIFGQFHHVKAKYLDLYLSEFCYKFNRRKVNYLFDETVSWVTITPPIGQSLV